MSIKAALRRARKLVATKEKALSSNLNQVIVCKEYNEQLEGQLVIVLANLEDIHGSE